MELLTIAVIFVALCIVYSASRIHKLLGPWSALNATKLELLRIKQEARGRVEKPMVEMEIECSAGVSEEEYADYRLRRDQREMEHASEDLRDLK